MQKPLIIAFGSEGVKYVFVLFQLVAIASRDLKKAKLFSDKLKFRRAYSSYDEVAADPDVGMWALHKYSQTLKVVLKATCINP